MQTQTTDRASRTDNPASRLDRPRPATREFAWIAIGAALLCTLLAPVQSVIWNGPETPGWIAWLVSRVASGSLAVGSAAFDQPPTIYFTFGRLLLLVYAGLIWSLWRSPPGGPSWLGRAYGAALGIAFFGDALAYGFSAWLGHALRTLGFWRIEVPALLSALLVGTLLGIVRLRRYGGQTERPDRGHDWALALGIPLAAVAVASLRYMPHGLLLPIAWALAIRRPRACVPPPTWNARVHRSLAVTGLLIATTITLFAVALPYRPIDIEGPAIEATAINLATPIAGLRLHVFNTGVNRMSELLVGPRRPWRAVPAFLIEHPTEGLMAFDLGLSHEVAGDGEKAIPPPIGWLMESRGRIGLTFDAQMRDAGFDPLQTRTVVVSHLHEDHIGPAATFANAAFIAGPNTRQRMLTGDRSPFARDSIPDWHEIDFDREGRSLGPFASAIDLFADGAVVLIAGGGHTPEDLMALVNLPGGPVLLTGDVVVHHDWLQSTDVERIASDPERAGFLRNQIRSLQAAGATLVIPGHDLRQLGPERPDILRHRPELFEPQAWPISP